MLQVWNPWSNGSGELKKQCNAGEEHDDVHHHHPGNKNGPLQTMTSKTSFKLLQNLFRWLLVSLLAALQSWDPWSESHRSTKACMREHDVSKSRIPWQLRPKFDGTLGSVRCVGEKTTKNNKIKLQKTRWFNVENPSNAKGKNHGCQQANLHYIGVSVYNANDSLQEE